MVEYMGTLKTILEDPEKVLGALESASPEPNRVFNLMEMVQILRVLMHMGDASYLLKMFSFLIRYRGLMVCWHNSALDFLVASLYREFLPSLAISFLVKQKNPRLSNFSFVISYQCEDRYFDFTKIRFLLSTMLRVGIIPNEKVLFPVVNSFGKRGLEKQLLQIYGLSTVLGLKFLEFNWLPVVKREQLLKSGHYFIFFTAFLHSKPSIKQVHMVLNDLKRANMVSMVEKCEELLKNEIQKEYSSIYEELEELKRVMGDLIGLWVIVVIRRL
jgi:hypothetical protein